MVRGRRDGAIPEGRPKCTQPACLVCCSAAASRLHLLAQFRDEAEAAGKLLPARHPLSRAVREVGLRIAAVAQEDVDGQPIQHMKVQPVSSGHLSCMG